MSSNDIVRYLDEPAVVAGIVLTLLALVYSVLVAQSLFALFSLGYLLVLLVVLWLFYRLVVAVEQIAEAQVIRAREATTEPDDD